MLPTRVYATGQIQRTVNSVGLDSVKLRDIARLSVSLVPDEEFNDRIIAACDSIEEATHLKLFQGSYTAEFDLRKLITNNAYLKSPFEIPGLNSSVTSSMSGDIAIVPRITAHDSRTGSTDLLPPFIGWPIQTWRETVIVNFTAGGNAVGMVAQAVGVNMRFEYYSEPNDALLLQWYMSRLAVR